MLKDKFAFIDEARGDKDTADALLFSPIRD